MVDLTKTIDGHGGAAAAARSGLTREHDLHRRRSSRNYGLLAVLGGFAVLLFAVSLVKLGDQAGNPASDGGAWTVAIYQALFE